jgi:hypothetical protein
MASAQTKTLLVDQPLGTDPVRIVKVMEGPTELKRDEQRYPNKYAWEATFDAGNDWLKDLSFVIKNVSGRKIVYIGMGSMLHETGDFVGEIARQTSVGTLSNAVGQRPEQALYSLSMGRRLKPDTRPPFELAPDEEFTIGPENPDDYAASKSRIEEKQPMSSVTACNAGISQVFFEDGTQWHAHRYLRADPDHPGRWIAVSFKEWSSVTKAAE